MSDLIPTLIGAGIVLLGIWLKARVDYTFEKRSVAAVVYAELSESMRQMHYFAAMIGVMSKYIDKETFKKLQDETARSEFEGDPKNKRILERYASQIKLILDWSKELGPKNILHTGPMSLGKLGPHLAYLVRSVYARIDAVTLPIAARVATGLEGLLDFVDSLDEFERELKAVTETWDRTKPLLLRAAGIQG